jgi:hypothetical protein
MAVRARLDNGTLRLARGACPNLLAEAQLYRYDPDSRSEDPKNNTTTPSMPPVRHQQARLEKTEQARRRRTPEDPPPAEPYAAGVLPRWAEVS